MTWTVARIVACGVLLLARGASAFSARGLPARGGAGPRAATSHGRRPFLALRSAAGGGPGGAGADGAARRYWDGMNRRDVDYALEQFSDDIFFQDMLFQKPIRGKAELRAHFDR